MSLRSNRPPPKIDGMISLKVDNLTYRTTSVDLRRIFERCGEVGDIYIPRDRYTRESRGFAFVRYYDKRDAEDALEEMDGRMLNGRELRVQMARYGRPTSPRRRNSNRRGNGRRRSRSPANRSRSPLRNSSKSRSTSRSRIGQRSGSRSNSRAASHSPVRRSKFLRTSARKSRSSTGSSNAIG